jgi:hypothetical protein
MRPECLAGRKLANRSCISGIASLEVKNGTFREVIYGCAFHCFSSGGVRDIFRDA